MPPELKAHFFFGGWEMLYAHSSDEVGEKDWQSLSEHLNNVADLAQQFAAPFHEELWARTLGLVHDAGKASDAFQERLRGSGKKVDHATGGAQLMHQRYDKGNALIGTNLAYLCAGHHGGLPNWSQAGMRSSLHERLQRKVEPFESFYDLVNLPSVDELLSNAPALLHKDSKERVGYAFAFNMHMLYSCLVDADFIDTERWFAPEQASFRGAIGKPLSKMRDDLQGTFQKMDSLSPANGNVTLNAARNAIRDACIRAADSAPGLFTLGVPTGAGKTLSSLAFALDHALRNGQQRIIYVIPFTSIVEQTAAVFKGIFGPENVLEHHSNYAFSESEDEDDCDERILRERLAMENWDAPLIVTTNVQFFESLYSSKPSRSRKVHNIANSVVILDEAQSLPDNLMRPCLASLQELAESYNTSVVLCSATQPALDSVWPFPANPVDIAPVDFYDASVFNSRVKYTNLGEIPFDDLAIRLSEERQAMCVVNTRGAASRLYDAVTAEDSSNVYHLSAAMVPAHRSEVLAAVRKDLHDGRPCLLVSTQLIEAGVDIDFPIVYRELAGLDSIKQAAGRCNREGKAASGYGNVFIFDCPETRLKPRAEWLYNMQVLGKAVLDKFDDPAGALGDDGVRTFFQKRYATQLTDCGEVFSEMSNPANLVNACYSYEAYDEAFKLIDDNGRSVVIPWGEEGLALVEALETDGADLKLMRRLQRYTVSVPEYAYRQLDDQGALITVGPYSILEPIEGNLRFYTDDKGLVTEGGELPIL